MVLWPVDDKDRGEGSAGGRPFRGRCNRASQLLCMGQRGGGHQLGSLAWVAIALT